MVDQIDSSPFPPSPLPPHHRPVRSETIETLTGAGTVDIDVRLTLLSATTGGPYAIVLPDGEYDAQRKELAIPQRNRYRTARFNVTGTIVGYASGFYLDAACQTVWLTWNSGGWHVVGGNPGNLTP